MTPSFLSISALLVTVTFGGSIHAQELPAQLEAVRAAAEKAHAGEELSEKERNILTQFEPNMQKKEAAFEKELYDRFENMTEEQRAETQQKIHDHMNSTQQHRQKLLTQRLNQYQKLLEMDDETFTAIKPLIESILILKIDRATVNKINPFHYLKPYGFDIDRPESKIAAIRRVHEAKKALRTLREDPQVSNKELEVATTRYKTANKAFFDVLKAAQNELIPFLSASQQALLMEDGLLSEQIPSMAGNIFYKTPTSDGPFAVQRERYDRCAKHTS